MFVTVTVALEMLVGIVAILKTLVEMAVGADCEDADCEDTAASSCWGGPAKNVSFVGLLQASYLPQQAHKFVVEL